MGKILDVSNLNTVIDDRLIIANLSFSIEEDSINAFLCPNNSFKTTLIKVLSGIINADSGKIVVNDIVLSKNTFKSYVMNISTVLEDIDDQFLCSKVFDEVRYPLNNLSYDEMDINRTVDNVSDILKISTIMGKDISRLTYFEKIKTLIAASIVHKPKVLFIDDIFRFLSLKEKKELIKIFKSITSKFGTAILFTTSDINDIVDLDNIFVCDSSNIVMQGSYKEIINNDNELSKIGFLIPTMIDLSLKLKFYKLVNEIYYDEDRLVDKLWN